MVMRFWFKSSELFMKAPFTLAGVVAPTLEEATARLIEAKIPAFMIPGTEFLSCNVEAIGPFEEATHPARAVVVRRA